MRINPLNLMSWLRKREDGAAAVEFALISPILILMVGAIFEGGMVMYSWGNMEHYARQAARAVTIGEATHDQAETYIKTNMLTSFGAPDVGVTITETTGVNALDNQVHIQVTLPVSEISELTPFQIFSNFTVSRTVKMYKET